MNAHERVEANALGDLGRVERVAKVGVVGQVSKEERRAAAAWARDHRLEDAAHRRHVRVRPVERARDGCVDSPKGRERTQPVVVWLATVAQRGVVYVPV